MIAFSTVDRDSFEAVEKWKDKVEAEVGSIAMVLVQNKVDLIDKAVSSNEEVRRASCTAKAASRCANLLVWHAAFPQLAQWFGASSNARAVRVARRDQSGGRVRWLACKTEDGHWREAASLGVDAGGWQARRQCGTALTRRRRVAGGVFSQAAQVEIVQNVCQ